jgi:hypothetical protein
VRKADGAAKDGGGVRQEVRIVASVLRSDPGTRKFLPIVRKYGIPLLPRCLRTRLFLDFSRDDRFDDAVDELLHELRGLSHVTKHERRTRGNGRGGRRTS